MGASRELVAGTLLPLTEYYMTTTFSIFFRFQVADFDLFGFFSLCHLVFPICLFLVSCFLCRVGGTEEHLIPAFNVLFWNQVVEANQFTFCALAPFIFRSCGGRIFVVLWCTHLRLVLLSASMPSLRRPRIMRNWSLRLLLSQRCLGGELFL
jgi:hypothetical protein